MKTPQQLAEEYADDWHKDCNYPDEILRLIKKATATAFLAGYQAGYESLREQIQALDSQLRQANGMVMKLEAER
jgi:flagellar biosynthesis/type III secretory pathway protein FliH